MYSNQYVVTPQCYFYVHYQSTSFPSFIAYEEYTILPYLKI